jgi:hypothetical protein
MIKQTQKQISAIARKKNLSVIKRIIFALSRNIPQQAKNDNSTAFRL